MSDPFVAEIRIFPGNFAPTGWALCNGQLLPISQNTALFSLLGTTYGGDGKSNFALPNLQGRVALQAGQGPGLSHYDLGQAGGEAAHALSTAEMPSHAHQLQAVDAVATTTAANGGKFAKTTSPSPPYHTPTNLKSMGNGALGSGVLQAAGSGASHNNLQPYLVLNYIIALQGIFPPRS